MIDRVVFEDDTQILTVAFKGAGSYRYFDVQRTTYDALCAAPSPGRYFNDCIRGKYRCEPERRRFRPAPS